MVIGVPHDAVGGERRVALTPSVVPSLTGAGFQVAVESGCGLAAGFPDSAYQSKGARVLPSRAELFSQADAILQVRALGANPGSPKGDLPLFRPNQILIGMMNPLGDPEAIREASERNVTAFALELIPRVGRAQAMDVLSSMATVAGYKAVLLAAERLPKMFPLLMTAAGTLTPARVLVVGAGVAGLQAIATARRLGAVVEAYDVRPVVAEQVESLGAKFVRLALETEATEDQQGYARALPEEVQRRERDLLARVVANHDVIITTAVVPGQHAPLLITEPMVSGMPPGAVIVDLAAEQGGNCELTRPGEEVRRNGVTILGPVNLPATLPYHASQMFAKNLAAFIRHLAKDGQIRINFQDDIVQETLVAHGGSVVHPKVRALLGLAPVA